MDCMKRIAAIAIGVGMVVGLPGPSYASPETASTESKECYPITAQLFSDSQDCFDRTCTLDEVGWDDDDQTSTCHYACTDWEYCPATEPKAGDANRQSGDALAR